MWALQQEFTCVPARVTSSLITAFSWLAGKAQTRVVSTISFFPSRLYLNTVCFTPPSTLHRNNYCYHIIDKKVPIELIQCQPDFQDPVTAAHPLVYIDLGRVFPSLHQTTSNSLLALRQHVQANASFIASGLWCRMFAR